MALPPQKRARLSEDHLETVKTSNDQTVVVVTESFDEMKQLMAEHWHEEKLLAETDRIEALVTPHISDYQWRGVRFEAVRNFIRNRRIDIEREIYGADMPLWPR